jgi:hypothetical protein
VRNHKRFFSALIIFSVVIFLAFYFLSASVPPRFYFENFIWLILFFAVATAVFHIGLIRNFHISHRNVVRYYMMATAVKLIAYIGIIIIYTVISREGSMAFVTAFFSLYFFYTVFEVTIAYRTLRQKPDEEHRLSETEDKRQA